MVDAICHSFIRSKNYKSAIRMSELLLGFSLSKDQLNKILNASIENNQIYQSDAKSKIKILIDKNKDILNKDIIEKVNNKFNL